MAVTKTALILVQLTCAAFAWENLPQIPANRRAEYYLQHDDGAYKYGYDTGEGQSAQAMADAANQVRGGWQYVNNDGQRVNWEYTAGNEGYVPLMKPLEGSQGSGHVSGHVRAHQVMEQVRGASHHATASRGDANEDSADADADASYNFAFDTDSYKRQESADKRGNIQGQYSYNSNVGGNHAVSYKAGEGIGFVVTSSSDSAAAAGQQQQQQQQKSWSSGSGNGQSWSAGGVQPKQADNSGTIINPDGSFAFSYSTGDQSRQESGDAKNNVRGSYSWTAKDDGKLRRVDYHAGADTGFVATGDHLPVAPAVPAVPSASSSWASKSVQTPVKSWSENGQATGQKSWNSAADAAENSGTIINPDGSYTFSYSTGDQSRQESADANNNVRGSYSWTGEGKLRKVDYHAGAETGFVATGDHLPVAPAVPEVPYVSSSWETKAAKVPSTSWESQSAQWSNAKTSQQADELDNGDASYSYNYKTDSSDKQETSDKQGNVQGSFSYVGPDGVNRKLSYTANGEEGFIATGDHLPVAPVVPAVSAQSSWSSKSGSSGSSGSWNSGAVGVKTAPAQGSWSGKAADSSIDQKNDGSYSYSYSTGDQSVQQSSDADNNVKGTYSFKAIDDGKTRTVNWQAGAATGFVAQGDHLPVAPEVPAVPATSSWSSKSGSSGSSGSWNSGAVGVKTAPAQGSWSGKAADSSIDQKNDGSYSYSYSTGDQSVQQSSDANNNVKGSYSFKAIDDGVERRVDYVAGATTGFVATGAHLPVAPVAPAVPAASSWSSNSGSSGSWNSGAGVKAAPAPAPVSWSAADSSNDQKNDGSYSYSYSTDTQSVQQSSDANNNVKGSYSFKAIDDGVERRVDYVAGATTGFVATGAHLPVAPVAPAVPAASSWSSNSGSSGSWNSGAGVKTAPASGSWSGKAADSSNDQKNDGSYSYSYSTDTQNVQQSSDANNNVKGSYSFKAIDDGVERRVDYVAGATTGFVATGAHLPVAPVAPAVPAASSWSSNSGSSGSWNSGAAVKAAPASGSWSGKAADSSNDQKNDGSYSYSYSTGDQSVQQSSDADNNVKGSYSFKAIDDGQTRTVNWQAGAATGFVAQGDHLPVAPVAGVLESRLRGVPAISPGIRGIQARPAQVQGGGLAYGGSDDKGDGSYSYSYKTDSSSKDESADAQGNVVGSFSYIGGDGVSRKLSYTARGEEGFVAAGDHLPVAPAVGESGSPKPYAPLPVVRSSSGVRHEAASSATQSHGHGHAHGQETRVGNVVITKYLPPDSHHKYGYVFDTKH